MNIGIDVDGVLNNIEVFHLNTAAKYFDKAYKIKVVNNNGFDVRDVFQCTEKQRNQFWLRHIWKYCLAEPVRTNASDIIRKLHEEGHNIYIITSRVFANRSDLLGMIFRFMLKFWLKNNRIYYDEIYFCSYTNSAGDKTAGCEKYKIDIMIEDKAENIMAVSQRNKVLCFDAGYNATCSGPNIVRVYDWSGVYKEINTSQVMAEDRNE